MFSYCTAYCSIHDQVALFHIYFSHSVQPSTKDNDEDDHFSKEKLAASNITLVTDMDKWDEKLSEADEAGKIVS